MEINGGFESGMKPIDNNGIYEGFALVKQCDVKTTRTSSKFLDITLSNSQGDIRAKSWDYKEGDYLPQINSIIKVRGSFSIYNGAPQMKIDRMRETNDKDEFDKSDFIPSADYDSNEMFNSIYELAENFKDEDLKDITLEILTEYKDDLLDCPAAFRLHHAIKGGLLMHTLSIVRLAEAVSSIYPSVDRELLIAGAILHDVCKVDEFKMSPSGLVEGYTAEGTLLGHLVMGANLIDRVADEVGADKNTAMLLEHMIISHHGEPDYGAAVRPMFLEAQILSSLDNLDADIYEIEKATEDVLPGDFSQRQWALDDRKFYNHGRKNISTSALLENDNIKDKK